MKGMILPREGTRPHEILVSMGRHLMGFTIPLIHRRGGYDRKETLPSLSYDVSLPESRAISSSKLSTLCH
jgi:hypothetical protein